MLQIQLFVVGHSFGPNFLYVVRKGRYPAVLQEECHADRASHSLVFLIATQLGPPGMALRCACDLCSRKPGTCA